MALPVGAIRLRQAFDGISMEEGKVMMTRIIVLLVATGAIAAAQSPAGARPDFGQKLRQNNRELQQYSFKRRIETTVKRRRNQRVELVRFVNGKMETVPLGPPHAAGQEQGRGLRGMIFGKEIEKKKEEMKEEAEHLRNLVRQYGPGSDAMRSALAKAAISRSGSGPDADLRVDAKGVIQPTDSYTLLWSVTKRRPVRIEIHAELDKKPVQITMDYGSLAEGPFYPVHTVLSAPAKDLRVVVDTFDYTRSANVP